MAKEAKATPRGPRPDGPRNEGLQLSVILREWRWAGKLSVRQVAAMIGLSPSTYGKVECGLAVDGKTMARLLVWLLGKEAKAVSPAAA